jgi:hypothetical protein
VGRAVDANRILQSMRFIREHHVEKLSIEGLARRAAMSPSHYAHRFRDVARMAGAVQRQGRAVSTTDCERWCAIQGGFAWSGACNAGRHADWRF